MKIAELLETLSVTIRFTEPMLGTAPSNPEVYKKFIESKKPVKHAGEDETATVEESAEQGPGYTMIRSDEKGLFLYDYMVKGFLKEWFNVLKDNFKVRNARAKLVTGVYIFPRRIYLTRAGETLKEADGVLERPLRAQTMQGPRVTLAKSDLVEAGTQLSFQVKFFKNSEIKRDMLEAVLRECGQFQGLGQWRGGSYGRFEVVTIT